MATNTTKLPVERKKGSIVDAVEKKIHVLLHDNRLILPEGYNVSNALRAAYLTIQEVVDKNNRPALEVCSKASIADALLRMVVSGLYPDRTQAYFVVYGKSLVFMPSYFGKILLAKRDAGVEEVYPQLVFEGDKFSYKIVNGVVTDIIHEQSLANIDESKIIAAYCIVKYVDGKQRAEIMTMKQIRNSWAKAKTAKVHKSDPGEMAKRTIIARALKRDVNSSVTKFPELSEQDKLAEKIEYGEDDIQELSFSDTPRVLEMPVDAPKTPPTDIEPGKAPKSKEEEILEGTGQTPFNPEGDTPNDLFPAESSEINYPDL
jgi:recombination protein RecT